jgi:hypothetical protein
MVGKDQVPLWQRHLGIREYQQTEYGKQGCDAGALCSVSVCSPVGTFVCNRNRGVGVRVDPGNVFVQAADAAISS